MFRHVTMLAGLLLATAWAIPATAAGTTKEQRVHVLVMDKMVFGSMPAGVRAGDIMEGVNRDVLEHSASARDGSFDVDIKPGARMRTTAKGGTLAFFCKFHPTMQAT